MGADVRAANPADAVEGKGLEISTGINGRDGGRQWNHVQALNPADAVEGKGLEISTGINGRDEGRELSSACKDDASYKFIVRSRRGAKKEGNCKWVGKNKRKRCNKVF